MSLHFLRYGMTDRLWLNDLDVGLVCFWRAVADYPRVLIERIRGYTPCVEGFHAAKKALLNHRGGVPDNPGRIVDLAFYQVVVQKTSFGGTGLRAEARGGKCGWIDSRWTPDKMCEEIADAHWRLNGVETQITNLDFCEVIEDESEQALLFLDPPYYAEGVRMYQHCFKEDDHERLADLLEKTDHKWVLTYGDHPELWRLYKWASIHEMPVGSAVANKQRMDLLITPR